MDGRIMHCGIISSCQSAATSEIVKRSGACAYRVAALSQVPDLYFLPARRYASAGLCDSDVSVRLSVCLDVCPSHAGIVPS